MPHPPLRLGVNVDHVATCATRAAGALSRSGARGADRDRGRRRRHHRASARGSPPHPRRRHGAAEGRDLEAAEFRDGGDRRRWCESRLRPSRTPSAWCRSGARSCTTEGGLDVVGQHNALAPFIARLNDAGIRVSLFIAADPRADRNGGEAARAGDRDSHRRLVRRRGRRRTRRRPRPNGSASSPARRWRAPAGLEVHAGHGLDYATAETIAALPRDRRTQHRLLT